MHTLKRITLGGLVALVLPLTFIACSDEDDDAIDDAVDGAQTAITNTGDAAQTTVAGASTRVTDAVNDDDAGEITFDLDEQNDSGFDGEATLTADGDRTMVVVTLDGDDVGAESRPMHIHTGSCDDLDDAVAFPLGDVVDGKSTTTVNISLDKLRDDDYAINVHRSEAELTDYVACGDIPD
ncbi:MAG: hypothetical protein ACSLFM_05560 [Tepidiformaceae bacterium]